MAPVAKTLPQSQFELGLQSITHWRGAVLRSDPQTRLQVALLVSFLLHLLVAVGVTIRPPERNKLDVTNTPLMVDLVNARTSSAPQKPDILAQANLDGGGNTDAARRARSPLPVMKRHEPAPEVAAQARKTEAPERETARVMTQMREQAPAVAQPEPNAHSDAQPDAVRAPNAAELLDSSRELVQLQAQINRTLDAYQKRPRRTFIGARAKEFRFARYIEDWRTRIERIGELNYPAAARGIYGTLQVSVAIRADGSLEGVEIARSSGKKVLDEAAIQIVKLAAPFARFPPDIAHDTDILSITRTWSFTRADQFQAE